MKISVWNETPMDEGRTKEMTLKLLNWMVNFCLFLDNEHCIYLPMPRTDFDVWQDSWIVQQFNVSNTRECASEVKRRSQHAKVALIDATYNRNSGPRRQADYKCYIVDDERMLAEATFTLKSRRFNTCFLKGYNNAGALFEQFKTEKHSLPQLVEYRGYLSWHWLFPRFRPLKNQIFMFLNF